MRLEIQQRQSFAGRQSCERILIRKQSRVVWTAAVILGTALLTFAAPGHRNAAGNARRLSSRLQPVLDASFASVRGTAVVLDMGTNSIVAQSHPEVAARRLTSPGSAVKPFVLEALLRSRGFDPQKRILCLRHLRIGSRQFDCTHPASPASLSAPEALAYSCNYYFAMAALLLAPGALEEEFAQAGLASLTGLAAGETTGTIHRSQDNAERQLLALGSAGIEVTPLELVEAYRALALRIHERSGDQQRESILAGALRDATSYGMASGAAVEGLTIAGKTGTSRSLGSSRTHAWFAGYAPADAPEIAVVVYVEQGRGPMEAAAIAHKIFAAYGESVKATSKPEVKTRPHEQ